MRPSSDLEDLQSDFRDSSGKKTERPTCTELLGRDGVRTVADGVPGYARVHQLLVLRGLEDSKDTALFPQRTPGVCHILFFFLHRTCQCDITGTIHRCHETLHNFWFSKPTCEWKINELMLSRSWFIPACENQLLNFQGALSTCTKTQMV